VRSNIDIVNLPEKPYSDTPFEYRLFSSRSLQFRWVESIWASPSLHRAPKGQWAWYWAVDLTFLSWLGGFAKRHKVSLTPDDRVRINFVRSHVCAVNGIDDDNWQERLPPPGAELPTAALAESVPLVDAHLFPAWPGVEDAAREIGYQNPLRTELFAPDEYRDFLAGQEWAEKKKKARRR
jgi:hypothetical protein